MTRAEILDKALKAVGDRGLNYGKPEDNFARIARRWNVHLQNIGYGVVDIHGTGRRELDGADVASMMIDVKLARLENDATHADSWIDIAGYAACGSECAGDPVTKPVEKPVVVGLPQMQVQDRHGVVTEIKRT